MVRIIVYVTDDIEAEIISDIVNDKRIQCSETGGPV